MIEKWRAAGLLSMSRVGSLDTGLGSKNTQKKRAEL